ncbi:hypothetical protein FC093_17960 [Ilyomonas limi]|uniref:SMODS and SLOG-associating 2TM effector domain-containing protein n=1 Tax=Ilyomonas limi TaxID=2575867 RepID=A0A4U3KWC4_9BACT|nr:hypothetical protein [Ilyomonas limi]TKK66139.1 hypothetical protein FC093_17960 [Ilyomonas limi]
MTQENAINQAKEAIGKAQPDDYILTPTKHAAELKDKAPALAAILNSSELTITAEQYENYDKEALAAQNEFRHVFNRANGLALATAVLVALVLATGILQSFLPGNTEHYVIIGLSIGAIITGALAAKDLNTVKQGELLKDWMAKRAAAECSRLEYFNTVATAPVAPTGEIPTALLKFEYFRRYQLDVQLAFFKRRGAKLREDARKTLSYSSWAIAGAAIATGIAGILSVVKPHFAAIATLGSVFAALSAYATIREQIYQSQRIAERYTLTVNTLQNLSRKLDDVRNAIFTLGDLPMLDFIAAIHEQLSLEHKQWLGEHNNAQDVVDKLEAALKKAAAQLTSKADTTKATVQSTP